LILWGSALHETKYVSDEAMTLLRELAKVDFELFREAFLAAAVRFLGRDKQAYEFAQSLRENLTEPLGIFPPIDVSGDLRKITAPTLVLHRRGMKVPPMAEVQRIAAGIPNARLSLLDGESSSPYVDSDAVLAAIDEFLSDGDPLALKPADDATSTPRDGTTATGTAVILFTDIVSSTELTERLGDTRFRDASRALDGGLRAAIRDAGGAAIEGKLLGDGVLATFPSAAQAIDGARRCLALSAASELGLHIGLHAGDVIREDNNVFGGAVNIAARICGLSAPGEILVSDVVRGMARSSAGVEFEDRGEQEMKGVGEPVRVYAVRGGE
jgi:class 3 adenylate cyclase